MKKRLIEMYEYCKKTKIDKMTLKMIDDELKKIGEYYAGGVEIELFEKIYLKRQQLYPWYIEVYNHITGDIVSEYCYGYNTKKESLSRIMTLVDDGLSEYESLTLYHKNKPVRVNMKPEVLC